MSIKSSLGRQFGTQFDTVFDVVKSNSLYDKSGGIIPTLDLNFAKTKSLFDSRSARNLINFSRSSTGTYVGSDGLIKTATTDEPRFDHDPTTGESLGLLIEEQRTNLLLQSEDFSTTWASFRVSVSEDAITSPGGNVAADKLVEDTTVTNSHGCQQSVSFTTGITYTLSTYVKAAERANLRLTYPATAFTTALAAQFNLALGTVTTTSAGVSASISALPDGWYRLTATAAATATASGLIGLFMGEESTSTTINYTGDGTSGIYLWGAQLEEGEFPTSYIPTTTAQVTRADDVASITGTNFSSWFNYQESTIYAEGTFIGDPYNGDYGYLAALDTGINDQNFYLRERIKDSTDTVAFQSTLSGSGTTTGNITIPIGANARNVPLKYAHALKVGVNAGAAVNGTVDSTTVVSSGIQVPDRLQISKHGAAYKATSTISRITYWPRRLGNEVLQTITQ